MYYTLHRIINITYVLFMNFNIIQDSQTPESEWGLVDFCFYILARIIYYSNSLLARIIIYYFKIRVIFVCIKYNIINNELEAITGN